MYGGQVHVSDRIHVGAAIFIYMNTSQQWNFFQSFTTFCTEIPAIIVHKNNSEM